MAKASHLQEKAALLGYKPAREHLAQEARREKNTESEKSGEIWLKRQILGKSGHKLFRGKL